MSLGTWGWSGKGFLGLGKKGQGLERGHSHMQRANGCPRVRVLTMRDQQGRQDRVPSRRKLILCLAFLGQHFPSLGLSVLICTCC